MAPTSVTTSSSSRLSQFGLYRSIDARTEEFLKLSRRRQLRQGCACAAVSTVITITVVVVLMLVYHYGMVTSETTLVKNRRKPLQWQIIKDSKEEGAMKIISKQADNKLKQSRFDLILKDTEASKITEAQPALKDIEEYSNIKNYFPNFRNIMKLTNRKFPIEYKSPRIHYSKSHIKRADFMSKFRRFQPLETKLSKLIKKDNKDYKIDKNEETEYTKKITTTSPTQTSIIYSVKRKVKVTNTTSINKALFTDKQNIQRNTTKTIENINTHHAANNVRKCQNKSENKLLEDNNKLLTKAGLNSINSTVNVRNASPSSSKSTIESQITQYIIEYKLCNNKDLLRHFLKKIISNCKKSSPKAKCKMACCNKNKTSSEKSLNETILNYNDANTTTKNLPRRSDKTAAELFFQNDLKYMNSEIPHFNVTTKTTKKQKASKIIAAAINSQKDELAKNNDYKNYANIKTNINIFKTTNIFTHINNTFKYLPNITPKTNITNLVKNQTESLLNQTSDVRSEQNTTTELSTNSKEFSFDESIGVLDKGIGLTSEDGMNESPSNFDDYFLPQKEYDHQEVFAKAIKPITAAPADFNNYEIVNGYKYFRPVVNLKKYFVDVGTNQSANVHVSPQKYQKKHSSHKHDLFKPSKHATEIVAVDELRHLRSDNDSYKTVHLKNGDDQNQSRATNKPVELNNFKTFEINKQFSVHSTTAGNIPLLYHAIKTLPFININEEATNVKAKINESINTTKLNNAIVNNAKKYTDKIKPKNFGAYISPIKAIKASNESEKVSEKRSAHYTTESPHFKNVAPENTPSMDKFISYKDNKKDQTATFSTDAVVIDLSAENIPPNEVIEEGKGSKPISVKKWFNIPAINDVMRQQLFGNEVRKNNATKQIQPRVNYSATLGFHIAPPVNNNMLFENILNANKLRVIPQLRDHEVMEKIFTVSKSNAKGEQSNVLKVGNEQKVNEVNRIENVPLEIVNVDGIDDIIKIKSKATNMNSTQAIKPKSSNKFTELREIMSSIKQKAIEQQSEDFALRAPELSQAKADSGSREISQETEFSSETSKHIQSAIRSLTNFKADTLYPKKQTEGPKIKKLDIHKFLQPRKFYSEEIEDSSQIKSLPETTTHAHERNNINEKCEASEDRIRKVNSNENNNNLRADISDTRRQVDRPKKIMQDNNKFLQPLKSLEASESATKIEDTTHERNTNKLCGECDKSEEKGKSVDSAESMDYLDIESFNKKQNLEWIKEERLDFNNIIKPRHLRAGLPSYLEIVRHNFPNPYSIKDFDKNSIEER